MSFVMSLIKGTGNGIDETGSMLIDGELGAHPGL